MTIIRIFGAVAIPCLVVVLSFDSAAQEGQPIREVYRAQAMGQSTQLGKTFNITINIERYSTPEERQVLVEAFQQAGSEGLFNSLEKMQSKGRIAITGTLGYDISFVRKIPTGGGYKIRILTNRPIRVGEAWVNGRSTDYNLSALEIDLSNDRDKSTVCCFLLASSRLIRRLMNSKWKTIKTPGNFKTLWTGARNSVYTPQTSSWLVGSPETIPAVLI